MGPPPAAGREGPTQPPFTSLTEPSSRRQRRPRSTCRQDRGTSLETGGGGGFGPPSERDPKAVLDDLRDGYITEAHARKYYAHAFADAAGASEEDKGVSETPE